MTVSSTQTKMMPGAGPTGPTPVEPMPDLERIRSSLGLTAPGPDALLSCVPFGRNDVTAGAENEMQAAVAAHWRDSDLPLMLLESQYYANIRRRAARGDMPLKVVSDLEKYLFSGGRRIWENSWVRLPLNRLTPAALRALDADLHRNRTNPLSPLRTDADRFRCAHRGAECLRIPISYMLRLALLDAVYFGEPAHRLIREAGETLMGCFVSDNTSPEIHSFHTVEDGAGEGVGPALAREHLRRYFVTQLVTAYANTGLGLADMGQEAMVYFAPNTPVRQETLNNLIPDGLYRDLFMSPCLSGWDDGEAKHRYMHLCHEVLSRSRLNALVKLKDAGIIARNLVVLPNTSSTSLTNNGTHVSFGSRRISGMLSAGGDGLTARDEKYVGDLVIKIVEHFLPLFVGTYSAAPHRMDFMDFHPEKALGFLPHELDYTHLRMIWRRWVKKGRLKILGQPITPFGPVAMDKSLGLVLRLPGDCIPDFRLLDYLVCPMSTAASPALNGVLGNDTDLVRDLEQMGIFNRHMSVYQILKLRKHAAMGFSGFEARYYSQFESFTRDLAHAVDLQRLLLALAYTYVLSGRVTHADIPDDPFVESERRQVFFGSAIGIPTFYVHHDTTNRFLREIVMRTQGCRQSGRYRGYTRVHNSDYRLALVDMIEKDAAGLIESLGVQNAVLDLRMRTEQGKEHSVAARLTRRITARLSIKDPFKASSEVFREAAESVYRDDLRREHIIEAMEIVRDDVRSFDHEIRKYPAEYVEALLDLLWGAGPVPFFEKAARDFLSGSAPKEALGRLIRLCLLVERARAWDRDRKKTE